MGWLYESLNGHSAPRQYLDAQFTYQHPTVTSTVLRSALVKMRAYYAAVEHVFAATGTREVWAPSASLPTIHAIVKVTNSVTRISRSKWDQSNPTVRSPFSIS